MYSFCEMPFVRVRHHLGLGEAAHLRRASRACVSSRPVSPKVVAPGCAAISSAEPALTASAPPSAISPRPHPRTGALPAFGHAQRVGAHDLDLAHGNAAGDLRRYSRRRRSAGAARIRRTGRRRRGGSPSRASGASASTVGREPGEPVGRVLSIVDAARFLDLDPDTGLGGLQHAIGRGYGLAAALDQRLRPCRKNVGYRPSSARRTLISPENAKALKTAPFLPILSVKRRISPLTRHGNLRCHATLWRERRNRRPDL